MKEKKAVVVELLPLILWLLVVAAAATSTTTSTHGELPVWVRARERRLLAQSVAGMEVDAVVAMDGSGQYMSIKEALEAAPADDSKRYVVYVKKGKYVGKVEIRRKKVMLVGDGIGETILSGRLSNRTKGTPCTATLSVHGEGFIGRDFTVENTAGPEEKQAVALLANASQSVFLQCEMTGYQDTLLAEKYTQFYKDCVISGSVDFIWGDAAAVFQGCLLLARRPLKGGHNTITAQGRNDPRGTSGFVFQKCVVTSKENLAGVDTFLGRPWGQYARVLFMQCDLDAAVVHPRGWTRW
uniref:Pectinesterase catalytic domain-containing protein n=1 Tax=Leersia perrieri TaxID=77586 RepID=A0A0D9X5F4_9ORYZ